MPVASRNSPTSLDLTAEQYDEKDRRIAALLNRIFDTFWVAAGWREPRAFAIANGRYSTPFHTGKLLKQDMEPRILVQTTMLVLQGKRWKVTIDVDWATENITWRQQGEVDKQRREWVLTDEDLDLLSLLEDTDFWLTAARNKDDQHMRNWPWVRSIAGVTYKQAEKNRRASVKSNVPDSKKARCPAGSRKVAGECVQHHGKA